MPHRAHAVAVVVIVVAAGAVSLITACDADGGGVRAEAGEMVEVPAGPFLMGCDESRDGPCAAQFMELPAHEVDVPAFRIDVTEATVAAYRLCLEDGACTEPGTRGACVALTDDNASLPVNCADWYQARAYCAWAGRRLCTEAEWEKAAGGTDGRPYPWGYELPTCELANTSIDQQGGCGFDGPWPVGTRPAGASPYGVLDMGGNVGEWVEDDDHRTYEGAPTDGSAWIDDPRGDLRVVRGGNWGSGSGFAQTSARSSQGPLAINPAYGIRCCR